MFTFRLYGFLIIIFLLFTGLTVSTAGGFIATTSNTGADTIRLYFPLRETGSNSSESANTLDTFMNVWYSKILAAMKEPILTDYEGDVEIYRFTWLRSFHRPIAIRLEKQGNAITLTGKVLNVNEGSHSGKLITIKSRRISESDWITAQAMLRNSNFWKLRVDTDARGFDGAEWILEGSTFESYNFTTVWSPGKKSEYAMLCLFLLKLSGIKVPEREIY
jgi:hypothetical protein